LYIVPLLFIAIIIFSAAQEFINDWQFVQQSNITTAQVIDVKDDHTGRYRRIQVTYIASIPVQQAKIIAIDIGYPGFIGELRRGDSVQIRYSRNDPSRSRILANTPNSLPTIVILLIGAGFITSDFVKELKTPHKTNRFS
jgi:hypothetical protein